MDSNAVDRDAAPLGICMWVVCCVCVCLLYSYFQRGINHREFGSRQKSVTWDSSYLKLSLNSVTSIS